MDQTFRNKLLKVIRSGLEISSAYAILSEDDIREIVRFGKKQSIFPIVLHGIERMGKYSLLVEEYKVDSIKNEYNYVQRKNTIEEITALCTKNEIPHILLKGAYLQCLYPNPSMRTSSDVDVLIKDEDLTRTVDLLVKECGYRVIKRTFHDMSLVNSRVHLEVHFNIKHGIPEIDGLLDKAWEYAYSISDDMRYHFTPEFQIFHVLAHMRYHMIHGGIGMRPLFDLWLLIKNTSYERELLNQFLHDTGMMLFFEKSISLVEAWMTNTPISSDITMFESYCLSGGVFGDSAHAVASQMRNKKRLRYLANRVFVSKEYLEALYPNLVNRPFLLGFYQARRWFRLMNKEERLRIKKEVNLSGVIDKKQVEEYDQFLSSLGL